MVRLSFDDLHTIEEKWSTLYFESVSIQPIHNIKKHTCMHSDYTVS